MLPELPMNVMEAATINPITRGSAAVSGVMSVELTRTELVALKETIELTPVFEGRTQARDAIREVLRKRRPSPLSIEENIIATLARRIVPIDVPSAALRGKLNKAIQRHRQREAAFHETEAIARTA